MPSCIQVAICRNYRNDGPRSLSLLRRAPRNRLWLATARQLRRFLCQRLFLLTASYTKLLFRHPVHPGILGTMALTFGFSIHRLGRFGSRTSARARPTTSTVPLLTTSSACARVLNPPVSISGLEVLVLARLANSIKYGPRPAPSEAAFTPGKYVRPLMSICPDKDHCFGDEKNVQIWLKSSQLRLYFLAFTR